MSTVFCLVTLLFSTPNSSLVGVLQFDNCSETEHVAQIFHLPSLHVYGSVAKRRRIINSHIFVIIPSNTVWIGQCCLYQWFHFSGWFSTSILYWALIGIPPAQFLLHREFSILGQFWLHTENIHKLWWPIEFIFNTPSHHRTNTKYYSTSFCNIFFTVTVCSIFKSWAIFVSELSKSAIAPISVKISIRNRYPHYFTSMVNKPFGIL